MANVPVVNTAMNQGHIVTPLALASPIIQLRIMAQAIDRSSKIWKVEGLINPAAQIAKYPTSIKSQVE